MAEHATNYESAMKRKSEEGERNTRAKRNRYISIAWWVIHMRAIAVDADLRRLLVTSARGERLRYLATPSSRFEDSADTHQCNGEASNPSPKTTQVQSPGFIPYSKV
jgi:hypothetical protein